MNISILDNYSKLYFSNDISVLDIAYYFYERKSNLRLESYNVILLIYGLIIQKLLFDKNYILNFRNNKDNYERILVDCYINSFDSKFEDTDLKKVYQNNNFRNFLGEYLSNIYPLNLNYSTDRTTITLSNSNSYKINKNTRIPLENLYFYMIINFYYSTIIAFKYININRNSSIFMCLSLKIILQYVYLLSIIEPNKSALENLISKNEFFEKLFFHLNNLLEELFNKENFPNFNTDGLYVNDIIINLSLDSDISDTDASLTYDEALINLRNRGLHMNSRVFNKVVIKNIVFMSENTNIIYDVFVNDFYETNQFLELPIDYEIINTNKNLFYSTYSDFLSSIENYYLFNSDSNIPKISYLTDNYKHTINALELAKKTIPIIKSLNQDFFNDKSLIRNIYTILIPKFIKEQMVGELTKELTEELTQNNSISNNQNNFVNNITTSKSKDDINIKYIMGVTEFNNKINSYEGNMPFLFEQKNVNNLSRYVLDLVNSTSTEEGQDIVVSYTKSGTTVEVP